MKSLQQILAKTDREDSLVTRLEELAKKDPTNRELNTFLAETYVSIDRLEDAEAIFKASLKEGPSPRAYMGLAQIYRRQMKVAELLENISKVYIKSWQDRPLPEPLATEMEVFQKDKKTTKSYRYSDLSRWPTRGPERVLAPSTLCV